jgi:membrane fusion protein (multidrug efflux system)
MNMRKVLALLPALMLSALLLSSCGSEQEEAKSMEQIYSEEGVPVRTEKIEQTNFADRRDFNAVLSGIEESSAYAMISDKVDRVYSKVGDFVRKDDIVLSFPTDNPTAQYYQAKVSFENAAATYRRIEGLFETGGISQQELDNARTSFQVAQANWDGVQQAVLVRAPISGVLTKVNVQESDNVQRDDELFTVSRIDTLKAKVWVPDKDIRSFKNGQPAYATWNGVEISGKVVQVDMSVNRERQAFGVTVELENPDKIPLTGVVAVVNVDLHSNPQAVVVERKDILKEGEKSYVFVADGGVARKRFIVLGYSHGLDVEVVEGLALGDELIVEGQMHLQDGAKIRIVNETEPAVSNQG